MGRMEDDGICRHAGGFCDLRDHNFGKMLIDIAQIHTDDQYPFLTLRQRQTSGENRLHNLFTDLGRVHMYCLVGRKILPGITDLQSFHSNTSYFVPKMRSPASPRPGTM